ncbi:MAG: hypothetical protein OSJ70_07825 [Bacilli bacterium]|nr:hypothetical protein [Bacilli bacterium]
MTKRKKIVLSIILAIVIIIISIASYIAYIFLCGHTVKTIIPTQFHEKYKVNEKFINASIKENTLSNKGLTLLLTNQTEDDWGYGTWEIEHKMLGMWFLIKPRELKASTLMIHPLPANTTQEMNIDWQYWMDDLPKGKYRIIYEIVNPKDREKDLFTYAEFEIK